jgi:hypothetical protein
MSVSFRFAVHRYQKLLFIFPPLSGFFQCSKFYHDISELTHEVIDITNKKMCLVAVYLGFYFGESFDNPMSKYYTADRIPPTPSHTVRGRAEI